MATDIADKDLKALRDNRWEKAFKTKKGKRAKENSSFQEDPKDAIHRKATIVIEQCVNWKRMMLPLHVTIFSFH